MSYTQEQKRKLADAVFEAIELADELGLHYDVDAVAEFAEDLWAEVGEQ